MSDVDTIAVNDPAQIEIDPSAPGKPILSRDTCVTIREEGLRAATSLAVAPEGAMNVEFISSLAESLAELDEIALAEGCFDQVRSHAQEARSNCARSIATVVRGAIKSRLISQSSLHDLRIAACTNPDAHVAPLTIAA